MTYEEIVRRVNTKSSICPECGCFISSLLDCCPACGWTSGKNSLVESYKALGGNSAVEKIAIYSRMDPITVDEYYRRQSCITFDDIEACRVHITRIPSSGQLGSIRGLPGQVLYCYDTERCYLYKSDYQWVPYYNPGVRFTDDYTDYTAYCKAKTDALQTQQHIMHLYEEAIKAMKSYSGNTVVVNILGEEIERVKDYYL